MTTTTLKQRKTTSTTPDLSVENETPTTSTNLIDEKEQEHIVNTLRNQAIQQAQNAGRIVSILCFLAAPFSIILCRINLQDPTLEEEDIPIDQYNILLSNWESISHCSYAVVMHLFAGWIGRGCSKLPHEKVPVPRQEKKLVMMGLFFLVLPAFSPTFYSKKFERDVIPLPWLLALGNVLTMISAIVLRRDVMSTMKCVYELEGAKYRFKNL